ncbi:hypothetical protein LC593_08150 [Nostoc sp. CHAB 5844]|nr:hypothetical protein [Nostoc sp. CHAB 5844]
MQAIAQINPITISAIAHIITHHLKVRSPTSTPSPEKRRSSASCRQTSPTSTSSTNYLLKMNKRTVLNL